MTRSMLEMLSGIPVAKQRKYRALNILRDNIPKKVAPPVPMKMTAPYASPGKGVAGESVNHG